MGEFHSLFKTNMDGCGGKEREAWEIIVFCWYKMMELKNISCFTGKEILENGKRLRPK